MRKYQIPVHKILNKKSGGELIKYFKSPIALDKIYKIPSGHPYEIVLRL